MMKRLLTCLVLVVLLTSVAFTNDYDEPGKTGAQMLYKYGLVLGENGDLKEQAPLTRQELAVMIVRMYGEEQNAMAYQGSSHFFDVDKFPSWSKKHILYCEAMGWLQGNQFHFDHLGKVDGEMLSALMLRLLKREEEWNDNINRMKSLGITVPQGQLTRGQAFDVLWNVVSKPVMRDGSTLGVLLGKLKESPKTKVEEKVARRKFSVDWKLPEMSFYGPWYATNNVLFGLQQGGFNGAPFRKKIEGMYLNTNGSGEMLLTHNSVKQVERLTFYWTKSGSDIQFIIRGNTYSGKVEGENLVIQIAKLDKLILTRDISKSMYSKMKVYTTDGYDSSSPRFHDTILVYNFTSINEPQDAHSEGVLYFLGLNETEAFRQEEGETFGGLALKNGGYLTKLYNAEGINLEGEYKPLIGDSYSVNLGLIPNDELTQKMNTLAGRWYALYADYVNNGVKSELSSVSDSLLTLDVDAMGFVFQVDGDHFASSDFYYFPEDGIRFYDDFFALERGVDVFGKLEGDALKVTVGYDSGQSATITFVRYPELFEDKIPSKLFKIKNWRELF